MQAKVFLAGSVVITQVLLWVSYAIILPKHDQAEFWGRIPESRWKPMLFMAMAAYLLNLAVYAYFYVNPGITDLWNVAYTALLYYTLQLFFLPIALTKNRILIRALLLFCVIPIALLSFISVKAAFAADSLVHKAFLVLSGVTPFLHVLINDFLVYSFQF
jgi:hypothetical protein